MNDPLASPARSRKQKEALLAGSTALTAIVYAMILVDKSQYLSNNNQHFFQGYLCFRVLPTRVRLIYISSSLFEKKKKRKLVL